jgi:hypothetical protein
MKQFSLIFLVLIALTFSLSAQSDVSKARWKTQDIKVDGNDNEWAKPLNFYDSGSGLLYAISNDDHNLYMVFSVNDQMKMRKIIRSGWTIELTSKEKKRKFKSSLVFPGVQLMGKGFQPGNNEMENRAEGNLMIKNYQSQMPALTLSGFLSGQSELKLNDHKDIQVAIGVNSEQNLIYEIAIPLKDLMPETLIKKDELITLNVNVNAMTKPAGGGGRMGGSGMSGGGMSGGGGGRMGGGMSGGGGGRMGGGGGRMGGGGMSGGGRSGGGGQGGYSSGDRSTQAEKASFKQKFVLVRN